jgi:hypothetical protein
MSVHNCCWNLDCAHEIEVVVAEMVGERLNLLFLHAGCVGDNVVMDWEGSCDCCSVCYHVEIEALFISRVLNQSLVHYSSGCGILVLVVTLLGESSVDSLVD